MNCMYHTFLYINLLPNLFRFIKLFVFKDRKNTYFRNTLLRTQNYIKDEKKTVYFYFYSVSLFDNQNMF